MSTGDRVIPDRTMDSSSVPISRLDELHAHIAELVDNPDTPIDARLLDEIELQLTETNIPPLLPTVLVPLTQILRTTGSTTPQDPSPLLSLTTKLLSPLPFSRVLAIADAPSLLSALASPLASANLLALTILHKAARSPADAAILSTLPDLVEALVTRWLDAQDVGVGERAGKVLGDLLETDCDVVADADDARSPHGGGVNGTELVQHRRVPGHGRIWDMIFGSEQLFAIIPSLCRPPPGPERDDDAANSRTARQTSIAQGRLLRLLPRLATINMPAITHTAFPDLIPLPQSLARDTGHGLLQWAALGMVDRSDMLMHLGLIDFFETYVSVMRITDSAPTSSTSVTRCLVKAATANDAQLKESLIVLPDRTVEEEAEPLRIYIEQLLN
ncbi:hypothetical protein LEL_09286 [Akanthomyces lecanii RCEF 1005]|uniref:DNA mismatch repair protein HSM3 N-terminal domain-containing protein n=1 Tax=Akanthomyces lecanii RCEF 1005 TaxID=1081108 RepID=A0A168D184_CORDF|nr:hypothetical protein LEL_09286 [Akanthomyces lecanii RCEF 1005]